MSNVDVDILVKEKMVPMKIRVIEAMIKKHPQIFGIINKYFLGKKNKVGLQITENGTIIGNYTLHLEGIRIGEVESGILDSGIHHPFGMIKPYGIMEKDVLEKVIEDDQNYITDPFSAIRKYMPEITIKFLK